MGSHRWDYWKVGERKTNGVEGFEIHWSDDGECITDHVYTEEDANLIASAPLMLETLKYLQSVGGLRYFFYAYITDPSVREIIDQQDFTELYHNPTFNVEDFNRVPDEMKSKLPYYVKTYVPLNKFLSA